MANEARMSEEKAKKAMVDAARLADELRSEQELAQSLERDRKLLECHAKEMQSRVKEMQSEREGEFRGEPLHYLPKSKNI